MGAAGRAAGVLRRRGRPDDPLRYRAAAEWRADDASLREWPFSGTGPSAPRSVRAYEPDEGRLVPSDELHARGQLTGGVEAHRRALPVLANRRRPDRSDHASGLEARPGEGHRARSDTAVVPLPSRSG